VSVAPIRLGSPARRRGVLRRRKAQLGVALLALVVLSALLAPWLTALDPNAVSPTEALAPPSAEHPFGQDHLGRDMASRMLYGARVSLVVGLVASAIGALLGIPLGLLAGFFGGWVDTIISWFVEVLMAFPGVLLALTVIAILGPGLTNVVIAVGVGFTPSFARMTRSAVLPVREQDYVEAARAVGAGTSGLLTRHIFPNILPPVLALVTLGIGTAILEGAALSFIGLGVQPPDPEWGAMLNAGRAYVGLAWWVTVFPGVGIFLTVLAVNLISDAISDHTAHR